MIYKKDYLAIFTLSIILVLAACGKKDKDQFFGSYFPLQVGNTWLYEETYFYPATRDTALYTFQIKVTITKDTLLSDGQLAFITEEQRGNSIYRYLWYEQNGEFIEHAVNSSSKIVKYKSDMQSGSEWSMYPDFPNANYSTKKVIATYTKFEFLNSSAPAFKIQNGNPKVFATGEYGELYEEIFAPKIGLLERNEYWNYYGPTRIHRVLTDYYIK